MIKYINGTHTRVTGWQFNNLTYTKSDRSLWVNNPLGGYGKVAAAFQFTDQGRPWRVECDTATTGNNACRAYIWGTVVVNNSAGGQTPSYSLKQQWVSNNIVYFNS